jgi:hypothetical protein
LFRPSAVNVDPCFAMVGPPCATGQG